MRLKNEQMVIKDLGTYFEFDISTSKGKKITSRRYPELLNKNPFNSAGRCLLEMFNQIEQEPIEEWYQVRGAVGEELIMKHFKRLLLDKNVELVHFTPSQFDGYDQFPKQPILGGVIDIAISKPESERSIIEVKSKSIGKLKEIEREQPIEERLQAELLATLSKVNAYHMAYVFFTPQQEQRIKTLTENIVKSGDTIENALSRHLELIMKKLNIGLDDVEVRTFKFFIDSEMVDERIEIATKKVEDFKQTKRISKLDFSIKEVKYLESICEIDDSDVIKNYLSKDVDLFSL